MAKLCQEYYYSYSSDSLVDFHYLERPHWHTPSTHCTKLKALMPFQKQVQNWLCYPAHWTMTTGQNLHGHILDDKQAIPPTHLALLHLVLMYISPLFVHSRLKFRILLKLI